MDLILRMFVLFSLTTSAAFNQVPNSGCNLITSENKCFSYFPHSGINWNDARSNCQTWGGDLASIASAAENTAVDSIRSSSAAGICWIGLNDVGTEGTFVWSDGSSSSYRNWNVDEPNNSGNEDCVQVWPITWNDLPCSHTLSCHYCSLLNVSVFGRIIDSSTFEGLNNNTVLTLDTTLYCVTENKNTPQVTWSYEDPVGIISSLIASTNVMGVSILILTNSNSNPGTFSCQVTRNQTDVTYTAEIMSVPSTPPVNFTVYSLNSTAIKADWNAPELMDQNGVLSSYQVKYHGSVLDTTERVLDINVNTLSETLTGLLPYINYCVMIRVENGAGFSEFSSPSCARTHEAIPSTPPVNFTVYSLNSTAIQVDWNAPELRDQNGFLTSYQVKYNGSELDTTERVVYLSSDKISVNLTELLPDIYYCVMIRAENGAGFSGFSVPSCTRTHEANPGKVTNCSVTQFQLRPNTCELNITFSLETPQAGTEMCEYNLLFNGTVMHTIDSTPTRSNFSYFNSLSPKDNFTFSLSPSEGCLNQSLYICYQDTLPSYDFVNGSFNITFLPESNIFNSSWTYRVIPPFAFEHLIELKILSTQIFSFKFFHEDIWHTQKRNMEYYLFSNQTNYFDTFPYGQVGMILERLNLTKEDQIILQCGYNFTGEISNTGFNYTDLTCRDEYCYVDTDMDTYPDQVSFCPQFNMSCQDNCPSEYNPEQNDCDNNGIGDVCDNTCEPETDSLFKLYWKCTKGGEMVLVNCPNGTDTASRMCEQSGDWSMDIDTSHCVSSEYGSISNVTSVEGLDIVIQVLNETMPTYAGDIIIIVNILDSTVDATAQSNQSEVIVTKTIQVIDFLTNSSQQQLLNQTQQSSGVVQKILGLLDAQAQVLAVNRTMDVRLNESQNVFFETRTIKQDQVGDVVLTADNIKSDGQPPPSVTIPVQNIAKENGNMSVSVVVLRNIAKLITYFADEITLGTRGLKLSSFSKFEIVTPVVSVQIFSDEKLITTNSNNTLVTLNLSLELSQIMKSDNFYKPTCLFLANAISNNPQWRDEGVRNVSLSDVYTHNVLACNSGHSTAFVVLIGINDLENQAFVLNILSYLGCSVSIICLVLSIAIYLLFGLKLLKKIYHFAHFQLSFSLLLLYLAFLFGVELAYVDIWFYIPCKMVTLLIEYLLLVVFLWMLLEGVIILIMVIWPFHVFNWKHFLTFFCVAWLIPLLYVIPFIPFFHNFYLSPPISSNVSFGANYCWLHSDVNTHIIYSVTVPIALIILVNLVIITIVIVRYIVLVAKQRSLSKFHRVQKTALRLLRLILVLFPVLGFGWAFGLLAVYFNRVVFAWMFTILCSFQGLSILIFVLLLRRDIQKSIVKKLNLKSHFSTIQFRLTHRSSKQVDTKVCVTRQPATSTFQEPVAAIEEPEVDLDTPPSVITDESIDNCSSESEEFNFANRFSNMEIDDLSDQTDTEGSVDSQNDWHHEIREFTLKNYLSDDFVFYEGILEDLVAFYEDRLQEELKQVAEDDVETSDNS